MIFPEQLDEHIDIDDSEQEMDFKQTLELIEERMFAEGLPELFVRTFAYYYEQLVTGETGLIPESTIESVDSLPDVEQFSAHYAEIGREMLAKTAVFKLNGGLGTSMGLERAKSLLPVKNGRSFLEVIAQQSEKANIPLVLMNSFSTEEDSKRVLQSVADDSDFSFYTFIQNKEPKIRQDDFTAVNWDKNPELVWCPPGHGDIYIALVTSGTLDALLAEGIEYAFVSNADNLGAVVDLSILGYFAENKVPFMMEVADRTEMDKKGGHLAKRPDGQLILRESAQCPTEDEATFQDIGRHKYFNTNNLWFHLPSLKRILVEKDYQLGLPMIRNNKTVDPRDGQSTPVYQLETAMGSAIAVFAGAQAVRVPRSRFAPVKTTNELLLVRSDVYELTEAFEVLPKNGRSRKPNISLDNRYYKIISEFDARFPHGAPSLIDCTSLTVEGDFVFGRGVVCVGDVHLQSEDGKQVFIEDGTILNGRIEY